MVLRCECEQMSQASGWRELHLSTTKAISVIYKPRTLVRYSSALLQLFHASRAVGGLVRLQEYGWSLKDGTCRTAGLDEPAVADRRARRSRPRGFRSTQRTAEPMPRVNLHCPRGYSNMGRIMVLKLTLKYIATSSQVLFKFRAYFLMRSLLIIAIQRAYFLRK